MKKVVLPLLLVFQGCTIHRPLMVSSSPVGEKEQAIQMVRGESSAFYFCLFGPFGDDSLLAAIKDARRKVGADSMVNILVDQSIFFFPAIFLPIFIEVKTTISGTGIRYLEPSFKRVPERQEVPIDE